MDETGFNDNVEEETDGAEREEKDKPIKREVKIHFIPDTYEGRCVEYENFSTKLSKGGKLPEGEVMQKYEILLPIPEDDEQATACYDLTIGDLVKMGVAKLATSIDDKVKPTLFDKDGKATEISHMAAQGIADNWRYKARVSRGKSAEISEIITVLVASGRITAEEAEGIETKADLMKMLNAG